MSSNRLISHASQYLNFAQMPTDLMGKIMHEYLFYPDALSFYRSNKKQTNQWSTSQIIFQFHLKAMDRFVFDKIFMLEDATKKVGSASTNRNRAELFPSTINDEKYCAVVVAEDKMLQVSKNNKQSFISTKTLGSFQDMLGRYLRLIPASEVVPIIYMAALFVAYKMFRVDLVPIDEFLFRLFALCALGIILYAINSSLLQSRIKHFSTAAEKSQKDLLNQYRDDIEELISGFFQSRAKLIFGHSAISFSEDHKDFLRNSYDIFWIKKPIKIIPENALMVNSMFKKMGFISVDSKVDDKDHLSVRMKKNK